MKRGLRSKRQLVKKVTSLNLYADQTAQIQAIMEATGAHKDAPLLRDLVDEALAARRRKLVHQEPAGHAALAPSESETLQTIQSLLKLLAQSKTSIRVGGANLALLQEALAEARGGSRERVASEIHSECCGISKVWQRIGYGSKNGEHWLAVTC